jgi:chaperonin GroEL
MSTPSSRRIVLQPLTYRRLQRGIHRLVEAIRPTLGPRPRIVAISRLLDERMPELLDNGGTIAKRVEQLVDPDEDMGAQLVRDMLWRLQDQVGDGTATAAVLFGSIYDQSVHYLTAGGNAMRLRLYLDKGLQAIIDQLKGMTEHRSGKEALARIAESLSYDPPLSKLLGEIFDIIGAYGRLEIRPGRSRELEREYVEGMYWDWGLHSREMITDYSRASTEFENPAILISDLAIEEPGQLFPALEVALRTQIPALIIVAEKLSDAAVSFLLRNKKPDKFQVVAVKTPGWDQYEKGWALEDLAVLTGGRPFIQVAGDTFERITPHDFGYARRATADLRTFRLIGGKGDPRLLRQHIARLRATFEQAEDTVLRENLLKRIGKLLGGSATLWIGGATELEIETRRELAERTAKSVRAAMMEGVVPGGGVALLACRPALQQMLRQADEEEERTAYRVLIKAMEAPFRTIVSNAGYDASEVMAEVRLAGPGHGFDALTGQVAGMLEAGIYDSAIVLKSAVYAAVTAAAMALTVDVLIHRKEQPKHASVHVPSKRKQL